MIACEVLTRDGYKVEYAYDSSEFNKIHLKSKTIRTERPFTYIRTPAVFDIEASTYYAEVDGDKEPRAVAYHFQLCIEGRVIFARTWRQLMTLLDKIRQAYKLDSKRRLVIYVHNLSYEWQFMYNFFNEISDVFATDEHKVLKATVWGCIEFRCSYYLSNMSLAKMIENVPQAYHLKAKDDLDYNILRLPSSQLTPKERGYCFNDVRGLYERLIYGYLKADSLFTIPLTSTGYVRRDCRKAFKLCKDNREQFYNMKLTLKQYELCKAAFRGGNTASNRYLANRILSDVDSYDMSSAYPYQMLAQMYPSGPFMACTVDSVERLQYYNDKYCTVGRYTFIDVKVNKYASIPYIPVDKCTKIRSNALIYNGRVLQAKYVEIALTNIDYDIIKSQYSYSDITLTDFNIACKDYLPQELRDEVYKYFYDKSTLKGVVGKEYEYVKSKGKLNALYGMCVTDILHSVFNFDADTGEYIEDINDDIEKYYNNRNSFLSYQWGIFVSAYTRQLLQVAIDAVGRDVVYVDTDSVKFIGDHKEVFNKINDSIRKHCLDNNIVNYVDVNGKRYELGVYDHDAHYKQFITMGAKKYAYIDDNDEIHITVSGLDKKQGAKELASKGGLKAFKENTIFYNSGRTAAYYNNVKPHVELINGEEVITASNIALVPVNYTLNMTYTMRDIIDNIDKWEV